MTMRLGTILVAISAALASDTARGVTISNDSFETPVVADQAHVENPSATDWIYTTTGQGSGIDRGNPYAGSSVNHAHSGAQQGYIQGADFTGVQSISQSISGFTVNDQYSLTFWARAFQAGGANPIQVDIGGNTTLVFNGSLTTITPTSGSYTQYISAPFTADNATMSLVFRDLNASQGLVTWIDDVSISAVAVPEPNAVFLALVGAVGIGRRWHRRGSR
jgi:hypothetical protein